MKNYLEKMNDLVKKDEAWENIIGDKIAQASRLDEYYKALKDDDNISPQDKARAKELYDLYRNSYAAVLDTASKADSVKDGFNRYVEKDTSRTALTKKEISSASSAIDSERVYVDKDYASQIVEKYKNLFQPAGAKPKMDIITGAASIIIRHVAAQSLNVKPLINQLMKEFETQLAEYDLEIRESVNPNSKRGVMDPKEKEKLLDRQKSLVVLEDSMRTLQNELQNKPDFFSMSQLESEDRKLISRALERTSLRYGSLFSGEGKQEYKKKSEYWAKLQKASVEVNEVEYSNALRAISQINPDANLGNLEYNQVYQAFSNIGSEEAANDKMLQLIGTGLEGLDEGVSHLPAGFSGFDIVGWRENELAPLKSQRNLYAFMQNISNKLDFFEKYPFEIVRYNAFVDRAKSQQYESIVLQENKTVLIGLLANKFADLYLINHKKLNKDEVRGNFANQLKAVPTEVLRSIIVALTQNQAKLSIEEKIENYNKLNVVLAHLLASIAEDNSGLKPKQKDELKKDAVEFIHGLQIEYTGLVAGLDLEKVAIEKVKFAVEIMQNTSSTPKTISTLSKDDVVLFNELSQVIPDGFSLDAIKDRLPKEIGHDPEIMAYVITLVAHPEYMDDSKLRESITKEFMRGKFRSKPNEAEVEEIRGLVDRVVEKIGGGKNDFYCVSPELREKIAREVVADHKKHIAEHKKVHHVSSKPPKGGEEVILPEAVNAIKDKISENIVEQEQQVVLFGAVWAVIKSSFVHHPNDHKKLFAQYEDIYKGYKVKLTPDEYQVSIKNFIKMFSEARGGRMDRSLLFSKEFTEAMKLHLSDPESSKALLQNLKKNRPYNPAELCKAYNSCMRDLQEIRSAMSGEKPATINHKILGFISKVSIDISGAKRIDNHLLDGLRDKMIPGSPFITSHKKRNDTEFAKDFGNHFPVLKNILEKVVINLHPKEYEHSKDKQKYLDREMRKMVGKITNKLQADAKPAKINVHHEFAELEKNNKVTIEDKTIVNEFRQVLIAVRSKKQPIDFTKVLKQAYQEDFYLGFIKKNCPNLYKKIDGELKGINDPLKYIEYVAAGCAAIMDIPGVNKKARFEKMNEIIRLSEFGAKLGIPFEGKMFDLPKGANPGFVEEAQRYKQYLVDEMTNKYPNIIGAITAQHSKDVIYLDDKQQQQYNYKGYINHINIIKAEVEKYDVADKASFGFLNKQLERSPEAGPNEPYMKIEEAISKCKDQQKALKALAQPTGQVR